MSTLKNELHTRKYLRGMVTRLYNDKTNFSSFSDSERKQKLLKAKSLAADIKDANKRIVNLMYEKASDGDIEAEMNVCENYEDHLNELLILLSPDAQTQVTTAEQPTRTLLKCPVAPLPVFTSTEGENLDLFISNFEDTTSKYNYSEYDRLLLLKQQVSGKAALLIDSLEANKQTYSEAKKLLKLAYATASLQKFNIIKKLSDMKLSYGDEPFKYISEMRKIQQAVSTLDINIEDVMQYYFLKGMNETFVEQLVHITNNVRPSLTEINENIFEANERYLVALRNKKSKFTRSDQTLTPSNQLSSMAVLTETNESINPFKICTLCFKAGNSDTHPINKCTKFVLAADKIKRLNQINGCIKCANIDHGSANCKFRFRKTCNICNKWHFTFLCPNFEDKKPKTDKINQGTRIQNNLIIMGAYPGSLHINTVLPTFSCKLSNGNYVRCLRDSGSQSNLIDEFYLNNCDYKILDNSVDLVINGINESKNYRTKLVQLQLFFDANVINIEALVLPKISMSLNLPGLSKVAHSFVNKGYKIADKFLLNNIDLIDNIGLILGADSARYFDDKSVNFGEDKSVFMLSSLGVMLIGDLSRLLTNLNDIPANASSERIINQFEVLTTVHGDSFVPDTKFNVNSLAIETECYSVEFSELDKLDYNYLNSRPSLEEECNICLNKLDNFQDGLDSEENSKLVDFVLSNASRNSDGRLIMPLLWNGELSGHMSTNYYLAANILKSLRKKLTRDDKLLIVDDAIREWESLGVIDKINNYEQFAKEHPAHSFLAHMPIFKPDKETTKCRVVFLSNLSGKTKMNSSISHNQAMHAGPCLNQKLSIALMLLRFDNKILCFDLKKAFLQIELMRRDSNKLLFLWFKNVKGGDFSLQVYRNVRLSFGLRCSPSILMLALFKILIIDSKEDPARLRTLKRLIYQLIYVDNGAVTADNSRDLKWAYSQLNKIFNPYKFELQQFATNDELLREEIDSVESVENETKLFGLKWNTADDTLSTEKKTLNSSANSKREILRSIAEVFDPYNFEGPLLNRARLFLHGLQVQRDIGWDDNLTTERCNEWTNICKQYNSAPASIVPRFVGARSSNFKLIAFVDSSKLIYGTVLYIMDETTETVSFLLAKNRMIGKNLEGKSIPSLELMSITLGVENLVEMKEALSGPQTVNPIKITDLVVYSDSLVALSWINSSFVKLAKMNKCGVYVTNRLNHIKRMCDKHKVNFRFVDGIQNPADCITRPLSHKILSSSCYLSGPEFLTNKSSVSREDLVDFTVPSLLSNLSVQSASIDVEGKASISLVRIERFSNLTKLICTLARVLLFKDKLKLRIGKITNIRDFTDYKDLALLELIRSEQMVHYPEVFNYFKTTKLFHKDMPNAVRQLNVFIDKKDLLRVGSKLLKKGIFKQNMHCPVLLPKGSSLTSLIIEDCHMKLKHSGLYSCLSLLRKNYWIPCHFSTVKKVLRTCVHCKRFNGRTIKLNQSPYRDFRIDPVNLPYANVFLDYMGPFNIKIGGFKQKVYVLCITCLWTRAINLKVSLDLSTKEFLRSFQLHTFEYGMPQLVFSDLGTQIVAGANLILDVLNNFETTAYFKENNAKVTEFTHYFKGHSELGSLVESCVKICKRLLFGAIRNNVLDFRDFEFVVCEINNVANKRPVGFTESLRSSSVDDLPTIITPELLLHGYYLINVDVIPVLQNVESEEDWTPNNGKDVISQIRSTNSKLANVRRNIHRVYGEEFVAKLIDQAVDDKDRYRKVTHKALRVGDIVLVKETNVKPANYPMCIVRELQVNDIGETTGAILFKGKTRELIKRHASTIIPLLRPTEQVEEVNNPVPVTPSNSRRTKRKAAVTSELKTRKILS